MATSLDSPKPVSRMQSIIHRIDDNNSFLREIEANLNRISYNLGIQTDQVEDAESKMPIINGKLDEVEQLISSNRKTLTDISFIVSALSSALYD